DQVALRAFERICKGQGTEAAVKKLRDETPELWRETVMRFRDTKQASSTGRAWYQDLKDEGVKKSERRMYNPKSKKEEMLTRVHVHTGEVERRKDIRER
ncbi:unnamed protein product, partial [Effrenium voratum]